MKNEEIFIEEYEKEKPSLIKWGNYIINYIINELEKQNLKIENFLKVPTQVRLKENNSILEKAFYRTDKNYTDPLNQITDKVGIRFVVLLVDNIKTIEEIIENNRFWTFSKDRDFEEERDENPTFFNYQSVHYIIKNNNTINEDNIIVEKNTPCEVQIRTLLQHAYSELTHDTVYKPKQKVKPMVKRLVARSMAMIETTDCIFKEVNDAMIKENNIKSNNLLPMLREEYAKVKVSDENNKIQELIIDCYSDIIKNTDIDKLKQFIEYNKPIISKQINIKYKTQLLFRQPIILLVYYLVENYSNTIKSTWPLTDDLIKPIYSSLGISFNN
ncbi:UNVERIFIED_ORG: hypothetical protein B2H98_08995 [Clostridium botulinum]